MSTLEIIVTATPDELTSVAANQFVSTIARYQQQSGRARVALSGGSTPRALFKLLASDAYISMIDWQAIDIFWGDERTVPPDHADSNYRMSRETLLSKVPIDEQRIHRMRGEIDPSAAATEYEHILRQVFQLTDANALPQFDLVLLGLGPDGHTASLFPHTAALAVRDRPVVANQVPQQQTTRLTLTAPVLLAATNVFFLVAGADKAPAVYRALEGSWNPDETPSQLLREASGRVTWMLDSAAAADLSGGSTG